MLTKNGKIASFLSSLRSQCREMRLFLVIFKHFELNDFIFLIIL